MESSSFRLTMCPSKLDWRAHGVHAQQALLSAGFGILAHQSQRASQRLTHGIAERRPVDGLGYAGAAAPRGLPSAPQGPGLWAAGPSAPVTSRKLR